MNRRFDLDAKMYIGFVGVNTGCIGKTVLKRCSRYDVQGLRGKYFFRSNVIQHSKYEKTEESWRPNWNILIKDNKNE